MPKLYVVATPIGNLQDLTPRAIEVMRSVPLIAAEDTRVTMKLCQVYDIRTPLTSCHRHNEEQKGEWLAEKMEAEQIDLALVTDAGTPCVSDPGWALVQACIQRGFAVIPVPGCCAAIAALSVCGFDTREFAFYGFLPREKKELREKLVEIARRGPIAVVHESPFRVTELLETITEVLPGALVSASCDLTKLHERTDRGTAAEVLRALRANPKAGKGEYCLVLDLHGATLPEPEAPAAEQTLEAQLTERMIRGLSLREAQEALCAAGARKNAVKAAALALKRLWTEELAHA